MFKKLIHQSKLYRVIPFWILDFRFWILKALPLGSLRNSNVSSLNPNGMTLALSGQNFWLNLFLDGNSRL
jgi:hypothetical protein